MGNYCVLMLDNTIVGEYAHFDDQPENFKSDIWTSGEPIRNGPAYRLPTNPKYDSTLSDVLLTRINLLVFSEGVRNLLADLGVQNIEYHPAEVEKHDSGEIVSTYKAANILGRIACHAESTGEIIRSRRSGNITSLEEFSLDESKIKPLPAMQSEALLFRLEEFPSLVLAHNKIVNAIENSGLTGFKFAEPEKYLGG